MPSMELEEVPEYVMKRNNLTILVLQDNKLVSLPPAMTSLTSLLLLDVDRNRIGKLFDGFGKLSTLQTLNCSYNFLEDWPTTYAHAPYP